jgi:hypothetical protein
MDEKIALSKLHTGEKTTEMRYLGALACNRMQIRKTAAENRIEYGKRIINFL